MLGSEAGARPHLRLESVGQCDDQPGRNHRMLSGCENQRRLFGNRGDEIKAGRLAALVARQRKTLGMRQLHDLNLDRAAHFDEAVTVETMRSISIAATSSLVMTAKDSV